jgi:hypothetical protein
LTRKDLECGAGNPNNNIKNNNCVNRNDNCHAMDNVVLDEDVVEVRSKKSIGNGDGDGEGDIGVDGSYHLDSSGIFDKPISTCNSCFEYFHNVLKYINPHSNSSIAYIFTLQLVILGVLQHLFEYPF